MKSTLLAVLMLVISLGIQSSNPSGSAESKSSNDDLSGVWEAIRHFGPLVEGTLDIVKSDGNWSAQIAQFDVPVTLKGNGLSFELPGDQGSFDGRLQQDGSLIRGHWIQPRVVNSGRRYASPVILRSRGKDFWRGEVVPLKDEFTLYLVLTKRSNGSFGALIRNPDRNIGLDLRVDRLERSGHNLKLIGKTSNQAETGAWPTDDQQRDRVVAEGVYQPQHNRISFYFERGGTYDFSPIAGKANNGFYARGKSPTPYAYRPPLADDDGWPVGTLEEVGMSPGPIGEMVKWISTPLKSVEDPYVHGVLVARHGKLVLEEYFYGFHRDKPHDTRSASKSLTSTLVGAAILNGVKLSPSDRVYNLLYDNSLPKDLDPRKKEMTLEHLMNMNSGYDCDDRAYPPRPGNEDVMHRLNTDNYRHTLNLPMDSKPGVKTAYCSINPNLVGAMLSKAAKRPLKDLFQDYIAEPLQMRRYYLLLQPTGEPYMGGGIQWMPREFLKLGQLMLNKGMWNGNRVISEEWAQHASTPMVKIQARTTSNCLPESTAKLCLRNYGYLWWHIDFPYQGRKVHAYYAGGNGGQSLVVIPELDMLIETWAGNYSSSTALRVREDIVARFVLPAVKDVASAATTP